MVAALHTQQTEVDFHDCHPVIVQLGQPSTKPSWNKEKETL